MSCFSSISQILCSLQKNSRHNLFPGDIIEYPRNKYFSHFAIYLGERDGVPYVAHLTCRGLSQAPHASTQSGLLGFPILWMCLTDSDNKLPLFGRALRSEIKMDPLELLGKKYKVTGGKPALLQRSGTNDGDVFVHLKVNNMLDEAYTVRDFHSVVKPAIDDMMGRDVTFDILFHNSEHQAALFRYGVKKSLQVSGRRRLAGSHARESTFVCVFQIEKVYKHIMPTWEKLFEEKKL